MSLNFLVLCCQKIIKAVTQMSISGLNHQKGHNIFCLSFYFPVLRPSFQQFMTFIYLLLQDYIHLMKNYTEAFFLQTHSSIIKKNQNLKTKKKSLIQYINIIIEIEIFIQLIMDKNHVSNQLKNKIREGPLFKRSKYLKEWKEKWVVLTMNYLFVFSNKNYQELSDTVNLKEIKSYKSYLRKDQSMIPAGFKIRSVNEEHYFCVKNCNEKWSWIVTLERLMDFHYVGSSAYNSLEAIQNQGFMSQNDFLKGKKQVKGTTIQELSKPEEKKKDVDKQAEEILKQLQILKSQQKMLKKKEEQMLKKQAQFIMEKERLQKNFQQKKEAATQQQKKSEPQQAQKVQIQQPPQSDQSRESVRKLKQQFQQKIKQNSKPDWPAAKPQQKKTSNQGKTATAIAARQRVIKNLFEDFHPDFQEPTAVKYIIHFLVKIASEEKYGYLEPILYEAKHHKNKQHFANILIQVIISGFDLESSNFFASFIEKCFLQSPTLLSQSQRQAAKNMLLEFFMKTQTEDHLERILRSMFVLHKTSPYPLSNDQKKKIDKLAEKSVSNQVKNWATKLKSQVQ